jgi:hypothetical protein
MPSDTVVEHSTFNPNIEGLKISLAWGEIKWKNVIRLLVVPSSIVIKHSTNNPNIKGLDTATGTRSGKMAKCNKAAGYELWYSSKTLNS